MPPKRPSIGQKKPRKALDSSPLQSSKKRKVSGDFLDIEQLNDVTSFSGVNLLEEEEQLFSDSKEYGQASEASRKYVHEEEERLILQNALLQKKLAEIMVKCGLKDVTHEAERCISLCVEERMRGLINNLIGLSKQRVDAEKSRHQTIITSDVRQQIIDLNRKAREEGEKKQAKAKKLQRLDDSVADNGVDGDKKKGKNRPKISMTNKEEDDKGRTRAAAVAVRAAIGGDDMLSKWKLMVQTREKREDEIEVVNCKLTSTAGRIMNDIPEAEKRGGAAARRARSISVKDMVAVLERENQMSKSALLHRLHERIQ